MQVMSDIFIIENLTLIHLRLLKLLMRKIVIFFGTYGVQKYVYSFMKATLLKAKV